MMALMVLGSRHAAILCLAAAAGCGPPPTSTLATAPSAAPSTLASAAPTPGLAPACEPLPSLPVVARAAWPDPPGLLLVAGKRQAVDESDRRFERIAAHLLWATPDGRCLRARAPLGEVTRVVDGQDRPPTEVLQLSAEPLGSLKTLDDAVAVERAELPGGAAVAIIHLMQDVRWGLSERHAVPVTIHADRIAAGDRVQVGRDAMGAPVYYGTWSLDDVDGDGQPELVLTRDGMGQFTRKVVMRPDADGHLRAKEQPQAEIDPPPSTSARDGHDRGHALHVCGPGGAQTTLRAKACPDGSAPQIKRQGSVGMDDHDGHRIDRYERRCGTTTEAVFVDIYHCP